MVSWQAENQIDREWIPNPMDSLELFADSGSIVVIERILRNHKSWFDQNLDEPRQRRFREIARDVERWREIEAQHGEGAAINLEHAAFMKQFDTSAKRRKDWARHLANARRYRDALTGNQIPTS